MTDEVKAAIATLTTSGLPLHAIERLLVEAALAHAGGSKQKAASALGVAAKTVYNKLTAYECEDRLAALCAQSHTTGSPQEDR